MPNEINQDEILKDLFIEDAPKAETETPVEVEPEAEEAQEAETPTVETEDKEPETEPTIIKAVEEPTGIDPEFKQFLDDAMNQPDEQVAEQVIKKDEQLLKEIEILERDPVIYNPKLGPNGEDLEIKIGDKVLNFDNETEVLREIDLRKQAGLNPETQHEYNNALLIQKNYQLYKANQEKISNYAVKVEALDNEVWQNEALKFKATIKGAYGVEISEAQEAKIHEYVVSQVNRLIQTGQYKYKDAAQKRQLIREASLSTNTIHELKKALPAKAGSKTQATPDSKIKPKSVGQTGGVDSNSLLKKAPNQITQEEEDLMLAGMFK